MITSILRSKFIFPALLTLLILGSFLPFISDSTVWVYPFTKALYSKICHGIGDRCFHIDGVPLHLCARCLGIYSGLLAGSLIALIARKQYSMFLSRLYLVLSFTPIAVHKVVELTGLVPYSLTAAAATGLISGFLLFLYISNRFLFNYQNGVNDPK
ncbi:MAG: DUF2085 domain-containing protein [Chlorobiota bacterium]|nr:MAG: DUF2085 domain-containing protein [Chlorobiota bacterium]